VSLPGAANCHHHQRRLHQQTGSGLSGQLNEDDPLWQVVLKIAEGDRERAMKLLNDPDSLTQYPEVVTLLSENALASPDGENDVVMEDGDGGDEIVTNELATKTSKMSVANDTDDEAEDAAPAKPMIVKTGDPREHLNLVFIGHVDAGKSTLSGNILYLTDNVDKRTIERYEKEAKERNRESWFLAFIMDTNEEERAKGKTVEVGKPI
jgi:hypothetical protein